MHIFINSTQNFHEAMNFLCLTQQTLYLLQKLNLKVGNKQITSPLQVVLWQTAESHLLRFRINFYAKHDQNTSEACQI
jgi:hypothetical protein